MRPAGFPVPTALTDYWLPLAQNHHYNFACIACVAHAESKGLNSPNFAPTPTSMTLVHPGGIGAKVIVEFDPTAKLNLVVHYNGLVHFVSGV